MEKIHYPIFEDLNKFKLSLAHEETSEISTKQNKKQQQQQQKTGSFAQWSKHSIYADVNVGIEISKYVYPNVYSCESSFLYRRNKNDPVS